jgi:hypothetical protein
VEPSAGGRPQEEDYLSSGALLSLSLSLSLARPRAICFHFFPAVAAETRWVHAGGASLAGLNRFLIPIRLVSGSPIYSLCPASCIRNVAQEATRARLIRSICLFFCGGRKMEPLVMRPEFQPLVFCTKVRDKHEPASAL